MRPVVHKPTQRYSGQTRLGRGFTRAEVKAAKLNLDFARSVGIAVDLRRSNKSQETLELNVKRIRDYVERLVLLPRKAGVPKKGNHGVLSDSTETKTLVQSQVPGAPSVSLREKSGKVTKEMNAFRAYSQLRTERMNRIWEGRRQAREAAKNKD